MKTTGYRKLQNFSHSCLILCTEFCLKIYFRLLKALMTDLFFFGQYGKKKKKALQTSKENGFSAYGRAHFKTNPGITDATANYIRSRHFFFCSFCLLAKT